MRKFIFYSGRNCLAFGFGFEYNIGITNSIGEIMYKLANVPYRLWNYHELPKSQRRLEDWETCNDTWIKRDGQFYNLRDFCIIGCPRIPGPLGGSQIATGEFTIAAAGDGNIYAAVLK